MNYSIKHIFHIAAPEGKVYEAIATIDGLSQWWTKQASGESKVDGIIEFRFGPQFLNKMKVKELKPGVSVTWECVEGASDWIGTMLKFELSRNEGKTRVKFVQENWKEANDFYAQCNFSWGRFMESLRNFCEKGKGAPFGA